MRKNDRATNLEILNIGDALRLVASKGDDGMCVYKEGHSDQSIADQIKVSVNSVANMRLSMFGRLRPMRMNFDEAAFAKLQGDYADLKDRYNKLVTQLALNKIIDCKHLAVPTAASAPLLAVAK